MATDSFNTLDTLTVGDRSYRIHSLRKAKEAGLSGIDRLPYSLKVLLENLLRNEDGVTVDPGHIRALAGWADTAAGGEEIAYRPSRIMIPDSSGIPLLADLAAMRDAIVDLGGDPDRVNPRTTIDFVVDHSANVDVAGRSDALKLNLDREYERNGERYAFLRWVEKAFRNIRVMPPGLGIIHQVNLEYLARVVWTREDDGETHAYPDCLLGMDSHTPMVNAMGILGWGVGGIEAGAAMLGQPVSLVIPEVVGVILTGRLREGVTATDLVLTVTERLRRKGVVQKFVEFNGPSLSHLPLSDRATIANMAPEYGATTGFFPIDRETVAYLRSTGRDQELLDLVEAYARAQGLWRDDDTPLPRYTETVTIDLGEIEPSVAGPRRPQDRVPLAGARASLAEALDQMVPDGRRGATFALPGHGGEIRHGDLAIAAITSCTNTSHPSNMIGAGLLARRAVERGLKPKPWIKTSLAPGSQIVAEYLALSGLQSDLDALGFQIVGFGCMTCMGNSGPIDPEVTRAVDENGLVAGAVLSGNRNFEGRIHPKCRVNYLASPPLVVAYALAGTLDIDLTAEPLGHDADGNPVMLADLWPTDAEIAALIREVITPELYLERYARAFEGDDRWNALSVTGSRTFDWAGGSTYIRQPPFFAGIGRDPQPVGDVTGARALAILGDSITTDHISPIGVIAPDSPAGRYLLDGGIGERDFHSYAGRRVNHDVMVRGTFANVRLRNELVPGREGGFTRHFPDGGDMSIYDAAMRYRAEGVPLVIVAGRDYGSGSSRDWAAKGARLLGVRAIIAEGLERIHRSNLLGMGVLPLQFKSGTTRKTLALDGTETYDLPDLAASIAPGADIACRIRRADGSVTDIELTCRLDTAREVDYFLNGGMLNFVLRDLLAAA